ncbi:7-cyano-7-deazaguanine synthase [Methanothermobacter sp.]|uniref:7-cyano-7-deazaguanine synthase n=1 Tax=Methanothermobacter sp. TaxID=1884223 RepID=UPI003C7651BA
MIRIRDVDLMNLESKIKKVKDALKGRRVAVGFSGGADSTALLDIAVESADAVAAFTVDTGVMPRGFIENASSIARSLGVEHFIINRPLLENQEFVSNTPQRCLVCKNIIYTSILHEARKRGFEVVLDGTTASDMLEDRPGTLVNHLLGIETPLLDAGITRRDVLEYLKKRNLEYSENTTCLATRIKDQEITPERINRVSYAETLVRGLYGEGTVRVRHEGDSAIIEVDEPERLLSPGNLRHIENELRAVGFKRVLLDLTGYRGGEDDIVLYRPCRDAESRIMFEVKLPYHIDIKETCEKLGEMEPRCSEKMGVVMVEVGDSNVTIFRNGKIVARRVIDREDAEDVLLEVLPHIIREQGEMHSQDNSQSEA